MQRQETKEYSNIFVFVCNVPDENLLIEREKKIIKGLKLKWATTQNDPGCERIHIIYLSKNDSPIDEKFELLKTVDRKSKIYFVGHCKPGSDCIYSDKIYLDKKNPGKYIAHGFSYADLGVILMENITNEDVIFDRDVAFYNLTSQLRRLKICLPTCHSATDKKNFLNQVVEKSFADKLFYFLYNALTGKVLACDIIGANGYVVPMGTKSDISNVFKLLNHDPDTEPGLHKRYVQVPHTNNSLTLLGYKPGDNYKLAFIPLPNTTFQDVQNQKVESKVLTVKKNNDHFAIQRQSEVLFQVANSILESRPRSSSDQLTKTASLALFYLMKGAIKNIKNINILLDNLNSQITTEIQCNASQVNSSLRHIG